jgi:hypothetical protein
LVVRSVNSTNAFLPFFGWQAFEADIHLMVFNAVSFNQPGSDIIASGKRLKQKLLQVLREHGTVLP